jgi:peptide/nickel transport system permease protein
MKFFGKTSAKEKTGGARFLPKFARHKLAVVGFVFLVLEVLCVLLLPVLLPLDPITLGSEFNVPPGTGHILGTDDVGRDLFARLVYGGRTSLFVGGMSTLIGISLGMVLGLISGYYRGLAETIIMRVADVFMAFPIMVLVLVVVSIFRPSMITLSLVIGIMFWPGSARLIHGNTLAVRSKEYVDAAKSMGLSDLVILLKYVLPNAISPLWVAMSFDCARAILTESSLSFLGAGIQPPQASWGNIIYAAQNLVVLTARPWFWVPSGLCLMITIISINFVGEGIRDGLDTRMG